MRTLLLVLAAALTSWATSAGAVTFAYTGSIVSWTVPSTGRYQIDAWGAQGGESWNTFIFHPEPHGLGAEAAGNIFLNAGAVLNIVVGGQGLFPQAESAGGGGGGSWVFTTSAGLGGGLLVDPLVIAGGGGGDAFFGGAGGPGQATVDGQTGLGANGGQGGQSGSGGGGGSTIAGGGGGGGGWLGPGGDGDAYLGVLTGKGGEGPFSFAGGWLTGFNPEDRCSFDPECAASPFDFASGGYGGGGAGGWNGGGGGGGFSGGGGGGWETTGCRNACGGGGGGSFLAIGMADPFELAGARQGDGLVTITAIPIPEPAAWGLMLFGCGALGAVLRRARQAAPGGAAEAA